MSTERFVVDALPNRCRPVHTFAFERFTERVLLENDNDGSIVVLITEPVAVVEIIELVADVMARFEVVACPRITLPVAVKFCVARCPENVDVEFAPVTLMNPWIVDVPVVLP